MILINLVIITGQWHSSIGLTAQYCGWFLWWESHREKVEQHPHHHRSTRRILCSLKAVVHPLMEIPQWDVHTPSVHVLQPSPPRSTMQLMSPIPSFVGENMHNSIITNKTVSSEKFHDSQKEKENKGTTYCCSRDHNALVLVMKRTHCEATKTQQWRTGLEGPKTICNACGVRYKSSRLSPEYRPAASPTFSSHLHSNSYKILKMRVMRRKDNKNSGILVLEYVWRENDLSYGYFSIISLSSVAS